VRRRRASIKVLQCHAVALDDEDEDEDGDDDDDDDDGQAMSMACQAREDGDWMCSVQHGLPAKECILVKSPCNTPRLDLGRGRG
jgi:hypothetical protein